jgi:hypothetical protein
MSHSENEKTRLIRRPSASGPEVSPPLPSTPPGGADGYGDPERTRYVEPGGGGGSRPDASDDGTRIIGKRSVEARGENAALHQPDEMTKLVRPSSSGKQAATNAVPQSDDFAPEGPVVGWLVVVKGPGRGKALPLGYGMNPIGREPAGNRVCLPFGDEEISRKKHAILTYDPRGRKFYLQHGDSTNLTYLGDAPVLSPTLVEGGETIRIGRETELRFVPLCGEDFDWETNE